MKSWKIIGFQQKFIQNEDYHRIGVTIEAVLSRVVVSYTLLHMSNLAWQHSDTSESCLLSLLRVRTHLKKS